MTVELQIDDRLSAQLAGISAQTGLSVADWLKRTVQEALEQRQTAGYGLQTFIALGGGESAANVSANVDSLLYGP
jgi:hypothetical protein